MGGQQNLIMLECDPCSAAWAVHGPLSRTIHRSARQTPGISPSASAPGGVEADSGGYGGADQADDRRWAYPE